jgi:hypothetical protein
MAGGAAIALSVARNAAVTELNDKYEFKVALKQVLDDFDVRQSADAIDPYAGVADPDPLEHTTRVLLLDGIITALGWQLAGGVEIVEEARVQAETTLYIDYLGVDPDKRTPLLIIEAKAWQKPFVSGRDRRIKGTPTELILRAIAYIRTGGDASGPPVTAEWLDWLQQVRGYVDTLREKHGHDVERVVITTGQWMVVFTDPVNTFCRDSPLVDTELMVLEKDDFVRQSDDIYDLLARKKLLNNVPNPIRATQLLAYLRSGDIQGVFHSLHVKHEETGFSFMTPEPRILVRPSIILLRNDGQQVIVHGQHRGFTLPHEKDAGIFTDHLRQVEAEAENLLAAVSDVFGENLVPVNIAEFPGFRPRTRPSAVTALGSDDLGTPDPIYFSPHLTELGEGVMAVGDVAHFLLEQPTVHPCLYHDWSDCRNQHAEAGDSAISSRSVKPRSFFISGEPHHCAHQAVHDLRDQRCKIDVIDKFLCCKACSFQDVCWPEGGVPPLPCGT